MRGIQKLDRCPDEVDLRLRQSRATMLLSFFHTAVGRLLQLLVLGRRSEAQEDWRRWFSATSSPCSAGR
jgi:hypothetical protein